jgi:hypothetical protein
MTMKFIKKRNMVLQRKSVLIRHKNDDVREKNNRASIQTYKINEAFMKLKILDFQ